MSVPSKKGMVKVAEHDFLNAFKLVRLNINDSVDELAAEIVHCYNFDEPIEKRKLLLFRANADANLWGTQH